MLRFQTFVADVSCPKCQHPITSVRADPRGVELPYCCHLYWVPRWKIVNGKLQFHLHYYQPEGMAYEKNIIHENEIQEDQKSNDTDTVAGETSEKDGRRGDASLPRPSLSSDTQTDINTEIPENTVQNTVQNTVASVESSSDGFRTASVTNPSEDADPPNQPRTRENEVPWRSAELTIPEKIVEFLTAVNEDHTATGTQIKAALGGVAPSTFKWAMDKLIEDGKVLNVAYNLYRLRT